jgi:cellobiose dehydrogenase (acceptor)
MTLSQYLGRGSTSRGRMTISPRLDTIVSTPPYLRDQNDVDAVVRGIDNMRQALKGIGNLTWARPAANMSTTDYVKNVGFLVCLLA